MRVAVNSHALPVYKKNRIASLLCIFETTIRMPYCLCFIHNSDDNSNNASKQQQQQRSQLRHFR